MADPKRVAFVSLGCVKNLVDSEKMLGQLAQAGCVITGEDDAEVLVINTCGFLGVARTEADGVIDESIKRKLAGSLERVVVAGCLVQRDREKILERLPGVDAIVGVHNRDDIVRAVLGIGRPAHPGRPDVFLSDYHSYTQIDTARLRITPRHYAYLRISEGCDQKCTFCTIPAIRGPMRCKPPQAVLAEARELVSDGVIEINLIGQDTTSYGLGTEGFEGGLANLLHELDRVDGLERIRLMYVYPTLLSEEIMDAVAQCRRVCNYIDIPLQHINDRILKAMHRRVDRVRTEAMLQKLRSRIPGVTIRTTMIAGFPGETEAEFEELLRFIEDFRFDALGVFAYSLEPDTPAGRMPGQLPEKVKQERVDALMTAQQRIAFDLADQHVGRVDTVIVDDSLEDGMVEARNAGQAPCVDSAVIVSNCQAPPGSFVEVEYTGRRDYDLLAIPAPTAPPVEQQRC